MPLVPLVMLALTCCAAGAAGVPQFRAASRANSEARRQRDLAAASDARQAEEERMRLEADRAGAAEQARRQRLLARFGSLGVMETLSGFLRMEPWSSRLRALGSERDTAMTEHDDAASELQRRQASAAESKLGDQPILVGFGTPLYLATVVLLLLLDFELLRHSQQLQPLLAATLACALTFALETLGLVLWTSLGFHHVRAVAEAQRWMRVAAAGLAVTAASAILTLVMMPLAVSRAEKSFGDALRSSRSVLSAAQADGDAAAIGAAQQVVDDIEGQYERSARTNQGMTASLVLSLLVLSPLPLAAIEQKGIRGAKRRLVAAESKMQAVNIEQQRLDADFTSWAASMMDDLGLNPNDVRLMLDTRADPARQLPAAPDPAAPEPGSGAEILDARGIDFVPFSEPWAASDPQFDLFPNHHTTDSEETTNNE